MDRLGIIDWGIGGIGILRELRGRFGDIPVTYFSDTGVTPYGRMTRSELIDRLEQVIAFLRMRGVTHILIGCNAASTVIDDLPKMGIPIEGVIVPAVRMAVRAKPSDLGLIGGRRTVVSGVHKKALNAKNIPVRQRIAQPLSALIESGDVSSDTLRAEARRILRPLRDCSHILLACTHYPAIQQLLAGCVSPKTRFIDPAPELVKTVARWKPPSSGTSEFLTSGEPRSMKRSAKAAFGYDIPAAKKVSI